MSDVTQILSAIEGGDAQAAEQLLPLVYDELRKLAAQKMTQEKPGQTLQATALAHEAYLRLVDVPPTQHWDSRGHFFIVERTRIGCGTTGRLHYFNRGSSGIEHTAPVLNVFCSQQRTPCCAGPMISSGSVAAFKAHLRRCSQAVSFGSPLSQLHCLVGS